MIQLGWVKGCTLNPSFLFFWWCSPYFLVQSRHRISRGWRVIFKSKSKRRIFPHPSSRPQYTCLGFRFTLSGAVAICTAYVALYEAKLDDHATWLKHPLPISIYSVGPSYLHLWQKISTFRFVIPFLDSNIIVLLSPPIIRIKG